MPTYMGIAGQNTARASALLPAAGAWDATPTEIKTSYVKDLTINFTYTRGDDPGAFDWQMWTSIYSIAANVPAGAQEWTAPAIYDAGAVVAGADTQSQTQREYNTYMATAAPVEAFSFGAISLGGTIERIRVRARESADGTVGTPGTLQITVLLSGGGDVI